LAWRRSEPDRAGLTVVGGSPHCPYRREEWTEHCAKRIKTQGRKILQTTQKAPNTLWLRKIFTEGSINSGMGDTQPSTGDDTAIAEDQTEEDDDPDPGEDEEGEEEEAAEVQNERLHLFVLKRLFNQTSKVDCLRKITEMLLALKTSY
jgi:hypothetical protein